MGVLQTDISPVFFLHAPGMRVDHNTFSDCGWCINGYGTSGVEIDHNTVSKMDHGVASGPDAAGQDGQSIHDNDFSEMSQWDEPKGGYHHDGIHVFSDSGPNTHLMIYGNTFHGSLIKSTTAWTFSEGCNGCSYGVSQARIFNNTYVGSGNDGKIMIWMEARGQGTGNAVYNNYSYEGFGGGLGLFCRNENDFTAKNNIVG